MITEKIERALNDQLKEEFFSASYYLSISAWANANEYPGTAHFFMLQAQEELGHAMQFFNYLFSVDGKAVVPGLDQPPADFESLNDVFKKALEHEKFITGRIHKLVAMAREENDYPTENFLQWFVNEQVEEEASMNKVLSQLKMAGTDSRGLFLVDRELGKRQ